MDTVKVNVTPEEHRDVHIHSVASKILWVLVGLLLAALNVNALFPFLNVKADPLAIVI